MEGWVAAGGGEIKACGDVQHDGITKEIFVEGQDALVE